MKCRKHVKGRPSTPDLQEILCFNVCLPITKSKVNSVLAPTGDAYHAPLLVRDRGAFFCKGKKLNVENYLFILPRLCPSLN